MANVISDTRAWKAPKNDLLPLGLLKACGEPLFKALASLAEQSFRVGYFLARFRAAVMVVIPKAGKTPKEKETPGGWRPISLLSAVSKIIEKLLSQRISEAAEALNLLPEG